MVTLREILKYKMPVIYEGLQLIKLNIRRFIIKNFSEKNKKLEEVKDIHKNERCFIVATGPSLTLEDLELIKDEITFGVNSCIKMFDKTYWRPDYYCIADTRSWEKLKGDINDAGLKMVFYPKDGIKYTGGRCIGYLRDRAAAIYEVTDYYKRTGKMKDKYRFYLPDDISRYICDGNTVIFTVLQIAIYMGFKEIYLLGTDCNYNTKQLHSKLAQYEIDTTNLEHVGEKMLRCYECIKNEIVRKKLGVKIINVTRGGKLEIFPRKTLEEVLGKDT